MPQGSRSASSSTSSGSRCSARRGGSSRRPTRSSRSRRRRTRSSPSPAAWSTSCRTANGCRFPTTSSSTRESGTSVTSRGSSSRCATNTRSTSRATRRSGSTAGSGSRWESGSTRCRTDEPCPQLAAGGAAQDPGRLGCRLRRLRVRPTLLRGVHCRATNSVPAVRRRAPLAVPELWRALLVRLRCRMRSLRGRATPAGAVRRSDQKELAPDLGKADHGHQIFAADLPVVELTEEARHLLGPTDLGVVVLDLAGRELGELLDLDLVDHSVEDLHPRAVAGPREDLDDHPLPVLARLVAEADRRRLPAAAQLVGHHGRVEVQGIHRVIVSCHRARGIIVPPHSKKRALFPPCPVRPCTRAAAARPPEATSASPQPRVRSREAG